MMKYINKHKTVWIPIVVFLLLVFTSYAFLKSYMTDKYNTKVEKANYLVEAQVSELQRCLSSYIQATDTLRILIVDSQGRINDFDKVAKELYNNDQAFRSIQLAPNGNVTNVYPLKGNEEAFGDIFDDPERKTEAEYARDTGETTLAGPFDLYQGGMGIVIRQPIYLDSNHKESFWGFSIVVLNVPQIFESANLQSLDNLGYQYQLWRTHPDTFDKQIIVGSKESLKEPIEKSFEVPGSTWTFSILPKGGWFNWHESIINIAACTSVSILVPVLCYFILRFNQQKKMMEDISNHDYLTGLYNARKMYQLLQELQAQKQTFTLVYMDLNKFKTVNDVYGHLIGDELLKTVAARTQKIIQTENVFRIGGDEFAMILLSYQDVQVMLKALQEEVSKPMELVKNVTYCPSVSLGYAKYTDEIKGIEELIRIADERMYDMKRNNEKG